MKISIFFNHVLEGSRQNNLPLGEVFKLAKSFGIDYCEFEYEDIAGNESVAQMVLDAGMKIASIYRVYRFNSNTDMGLAEEHLALAKKYDVPEIMIVPGFFSDAGDDNVCFREKEQMISCTKEVCRLAVEKNLVPVIENFDDRRSSVAKTEQLVEYCNRIPELRIAFDTGNFLFSAESEIASFDILKDKIYHVHCKDRSLEVTPGNDERIAVDGRTLYPVPVGEGVIKMAEIMELLRGISYDGVYAIEHYGAENHIEYMRKSAAWLLSHAGI